jgi:hypothetical protein
MAKAVICEGKDRASRRKYAEEGRRDERCTTRPIDCCQSLVYRQQIDEVDQPPLMNDVCAALRTILEEALIMEVNLPLVSKEYYQ